MCWKHRRKFYAKSMDYWKSFSFYLSIFPHHWVSAIYSYLSQQKIVVVWNVLSPLPVPFISHLALFDWLLNTAAVLCFLHVYNKPMDTHAPRVILLALLSHCTFLHVNSRHVKQPLITMLHSRSDCKTVPFLGSFLCTSFYNMIRIRRKQIISSILFKDFSFLFGQQLLTSRFHYFLFRRQ